MRDISHDILDLLPEPHRTLAKQRRADAPREAQTPNSDIPRHLRIALASATRAFQSGDLSTLGTANEDLQPLIDAAIAWGRRQGKNTPDLITAPVEGVDVEEVLRLDREATPGPWRAVGASIRVTLPGGIEYQWATASYPRDTALMVNYRTAAPALAREVVALRAALATAEAERDELRLTLAAERGQAEGAPHPDWRYDAGTWERYYDDGDSAIVYSDGTWARGPFGACARHKGRASNRRAAMIAADAALSGEATTSPSAPAPQGSQTPQ